MSEESGLKTYCIGIVTKNKPVGTDIIEFYPSEKLSFEDGKVDEIKEEKSSATPNINGVTHQAKSERSAVMEARWFPDGNDGRQTAPDVVNGETVRIYRYADSETYYWNTMLREPNLRRLEHVVTAYSNLKSGRKPFGVESSYGWLFSTLDKKVRIWTSQSDGESFSYELLIDTKENTVRLKDNVGNEFGINSEEKIVFLKNADNSQVVLNGSKIETSSSESISETTGSKVINAPGGINITAPNVSTSGAMDVAGGLSAGGVSTSGSVSAGGSIQGSSVIIGGGGGGMRTTGVEEPPVDVKVSLDKHQEEIDILNDQVRILQEEVLTLQEDNRLIKENFNNLSDRVNTFINNHGPV